MARDIGRRRAYRAEAQAFGGAWFESTCKSPLINEAQGRALHLEVAQFLKAELAALSHKALPKFETSAKSNSFYRGGACYYRLNGLRASVVLHEVAHWADTSGDLSHGKPWQKIFALVIRKFVDEQTADMFLRLCEELPIMKVAAGPKRRWILQEMTQDGWIDSKRLRGTIPNKYILRMWRGDECRLGHADGPVTCYRMIQDVP